MNLQACLFFILKKKEEEEEEGHTLQNTHTDSSIKMIYIPKMHRIRNINLAHSPADTICCSPLKIASGLKNCGVKHVNSLGPDFSPPEVVGENRRD